MASLSPRVPPGCLRQPSRSFGTLPSPLSCQINIFVKNVDTSHAKSMFWLDLQGITRICLHLGWTCQDWKDLEGFGVKISLKDQKPTKYTQFCLGSSFLQGKNAGGRLLRKPHTCQQRRHRHCQQRRHRHCQQRRHLHCQQRRHLH